jgi:hypothetical protein
MQKTSKWVTIVDTIVSDHMKETCSWHELALSAVALTMMDAMAMRGHVVGGISLPAVKAWSGRSCSARE